VCCGNQAQGETDWLTKIRREFKEHQSVDKKDFGAIEHLLRMGTRKLELYSSPGIKNISA
jgi:succinate dehydrogenase assembly factor 1